MGKVYVKKVRGKFHLVTKYHDGSTKWRVTKCTRRRDAERLAKQKEDELRLQVTSKTVLTFDEACLEYDKRKLSKLSPSYKTGTWSVFKKVKALEPIATTEHINQRWLDSVTDGITIKELGKKARLRNRQTCKGNSKLLSNNGTMKTEIRGKRPMRFSAGEICSRFSRF